MNTYEKLAKDFLNNVYGNVAYPNGLLKSLSELLENLSIEVTEKTIDRLVENDYFEPYDHGCR